MEMTEDVMGMCGPNTQLRRRSGVEMTEDVMGMCGPK